MPSELQIQSLKRSMLPLSPYPVAILMSDRKNRQVGEVFGAGFSWPAAIDAAADVYNGVRIAILW